jgi:signal transduction histidine kinase/CheY-like chemotaxis protein
VEGQILVVDSQATSRSKIVDEVLAPKGYRTAVAADAAQAQILIRDATPQLIVLNADCVGSGYLDALATLRQQGIACPALVILPPGVTQLDVRALRLGVQDALTEPFEAAEFEAAVEHALLPQRLPLTHDPSQERSQQPFEEHRRLYTIGRAITTQIDYQGVCDRLVEAAVYLTGADEGALFLKDPTTGQVRLRSRVLKGDRIATGVDEPVRDAAVQHALLSSSPQIRSGTPATLDVPLQIRDQARGVLRVSNAKEGPAFGPTTSERLSVLASYAVLALENAELLSGIQDAIERTTISQIGTLLASKLAVQDVLDTIISAGARIVGADRGYIVLRDEQGEQFVPRASYGVGLDELGDLRFACARQTVEHVLETCQPASGMTEPVPWAEGGPALPRAMLCIPIQGREGLAGAIYLDRMEAQPPFSGHDRSMIAALASHAAMALENAHLFGRVESESRKLDAVLRGTVQPVIVADETGDVLLVNWAARRALQIRSDPESGAPSRAVTPPVLSRLIDRALLSGEVQHSEIVLDEGQTYSATVTPIPSVGVVTVLQDITDIKRLSELKSEFVSTVSHDLRSPLSVVQGFLAVLGQAGPLNARQIDFIASAQRELMYLFDLTADLLDLGQVESGMDVEMVPCDLCGIVQEALGGWQQAGLPARHTIELSLPAEEVRVRGHAALLRRVVDNLVSNAVKYTPPGGQIEIRLRLREEEAELQVEDNGIGISAADQPYVFDRFYRAKNPITRNIKGTGLGLSIVRSVTERHGGRVWLESELDVGTTVGVVLPLLDAPLPIEE